MQVQVQVQVQADHKVFQGERAVFGAYRQVHSFMQPRSCLCKGCACQKNNLSVAGTQAGGGSCTRDARLTRRHRAAPANHQAGQGGCHKAKRGHHVTPNRLGAHPTPWMHLQPHIDRRAGASPPPFRKAGELFSAVEGDGQSVPQRRALDTCDVEQLLADLCERHSAGQGATMFSASGRRGQWRGGSRVAPAALRRSRSRPPLRQGQMRRDAI
jgi:hypothetical protein